MSWQRFNTMMMGEQGAVQLEVFDNTDGPILIIRVSCVRCGHLFSQEKYDVEREARHELERRADQIIKRDTSLFARHECRAKSH